MDTKITERTIPSLIIEGKQQYISTRRWNDHAIMEFLMSQLPSKWQEIGVIAKVAYGQNIPSTKDRARRNVPKLFRYMLFQHGVFLVAEYGPPHGKVKAIKILDRTSEMECQIATEKLTKMHKRKILSDDMYVRAIDAIK